MSSGLETLTATHRYINSRVISPPMRADARWQKHHADWNNGNQEWRIKQPREIGRMEHKFTGETCRTRDAILVCCILRGPDIALRLLVRSFSNAADWSQLKCDICSPIGPSNTFLFLLPTFSSAQWRRKASCA